MMSAPLFFQSAGRGLILILFAFITGNSSLEALLEGLLSQIHMNLSSRFSAGIEPGSCE